MGAAIHVIKNTFSIAFSNIAAKVIAFLITIYLAKYLGVENFGKYTFIITYLMLFSFIVGFGLDPVVIRDISRKDYLANKIMGNAIIIRIITSLISVLLAIIGIHALHYPSETIYYTQIASVALIFQGISYLIESLFQAKLKMHFSAISLITSKIIYALMLYYIMKNNLNLTQIFVAYILSEMIRMLISYFYSKRLLNFELQFDFNFCKDLIRQASPFILGYGLSALYNRFDIVMLSILQGDIAVGFYSAAYKLTESVLFLPGALASTLMPILAKKYIDDKENYRNIYNLGNKYIFMLLFPISIGGVVLGNEIISTIYTDDFSNSVLVFQILTFTIIFNSLNYMQITGLVASNLQNLNNLSISICTILNIVLNILLIPSYSYIGAGIATLISVICLYMFGFYFVHKRLNLQPLNSEYIKYIAASIAMGYIIHNIQIYILYKIILGMIIYIIIILLLKGFDKHDLQLLK
jgi:O-antigen/teichoic acid export membrane protein